MPADDDGATHIVAGVGKPPGNEPGALWVAIGPPGGRARADILRGSGQIGGELAGALKAEVTAARPDCFGVHLQDPSGVGHKKAPRWSVGARISVCAAIASKVGVDGE